MAMLEADFANAIEDLAATWRTSIESGKRDDDSHKNGWEDARVLEQFGTRYLRITKKLVSATEERSAELHEDQKSEAPIEEDDPEALIPAIPTNQDHKLTVRYDIVYSPAYQVPVLYMTFANPESGKSIPLPSPEQIYTLLVPDDFKSTMHDVGIMGALSMSDHPVAGVPAYFVHPCRTQEALAPLLGRTSSISGERERLEYLMLWFGVIGASVGLSVPVKVARLFANEDGELGRR